MGHRRLVNCKIFVVVSGMLDKPWELRKCVNFFHFMNWFRFGYDFGNLNMVVEDLCRSKLFV